MAATSSPSMVEEGNPEFLCAMHRSPSSQNWHRHKSEHPGSLLPTPRGSWYLLLKNGGGKPEDRTNMHLALGHFSTVPVMALVLFQPP